jgi:cation/acetate symporter
MKALEADAAAILAAEKGKLEAKVAELKAAATPDEKAIAAAEKAVADFPEGRRRGQGRLEEGRRRRQGQGRPGQGPRPALPRCGRGRARQGALNFIALVLCLMVGTASLPHILMRYYTTPSVREARISVGWSLFFIFLLYFSAPALAVLVKFEVYSNLVGSSFANCRPGSPTGRRWTRR